MKLHNAIEQVIKYNDRGMTIKEIALEIDENNLYVRKDGHPIPASQILSRVKNYPSLFSFREGKVFLVKNEISLFDDESSVIPLEVILTKLDVLLIKNYRIKDIQRLLFISELIAVAKELLIITDDYSFLKDEHFIAFLKRNNFKAPEYAFKTFARYTDIFQDIYQEHIKRILLPSLNSLDKKQAFKVMQGFLQNSTYFIKDESFKHITPSYVNKLLVSITKPRNNDIVYDPASGRGGTLLEAFRWNSNIKLFGQEINAEIAALGYMNMLFSNLDKFVLKSSDALMEPMINEKKADVVVSDLPAKHKIHPSGHYDFSFISNDNSIETRLFEMLLTRLNPDTGRMALIVPDNFLRKETNSEVKRRIIEYDQLEAVISLPIPQQNLFNQQKSNIIVINYQKDNSKIGKVLFISARNDSEADKQYDNLLRSEHHTDLFVKEILEIYSSNQEASQIPSNLASNEEVIEHIYDLWPGIYTSDIKDYLSQVEENEKVISLEDVLIPCKYSKEWQWRGGIKHLQIGDLSDSDGESSIDLKKLRPLNQVKKNYNIISESALLLARVGNKLKPTYFNYKNEPVAIISNIFAFQVKEDLINVEYLINQLNSEIVKKQLDSLRSGGVIPHINTRLLFNVKIPLPSLSEQYNRLAAYREQQASKLTLTKFIRSIELATTPEEIKEEIERFAKTVFTNNENIVFKREMDFEKLPFSPKDISEAKYIKYPREGGYAYLLLIDENKKIFGVLTIQTDRQISWDRYSEVNEYARFVVNTSSKYIHENTNKLLNDFNHTTKNILTGISLRIKEILDTKNDTLLDALKSSYYEDMDIMEDSIKREGRSRDSFFAYNRLNEALKIVNKQVEYFKDRHLSYKTMINSKPEEIKPNKLLDLLNVDKSKLDISDFTSNATLLFIKVQPIELALTDIIDNAVRYSSGGKVKIEIKEKESYVAISIVNEVSQLISENNYKLLGHEDIKNDDNTYSTGLHNAFRVINQENDISLIPFERYCSDKLFAVNIKLKKNEKTI